MSLGLLVSAYRAVAAIGCGQKNSKYSCAFPRKVPLPAPEHLRLSLGIPLLRNSTDGTIALTPDGEEFARNALAALNAVDASNYKAAEPAHNG
jgi:hypothetical protein